MNADVLVGEKRRREIRVEDVRNYLHLAKNVSSSWTGAAMNIVYAKSVTNNRAFVTFNFSVTEDKTLALSCKIPDHSIDLLFNEEELHCTMLWLEWS